MLDVTPKWDRLRLALVQGDREVSVQGVPAWSTDFCPDDRGVVSAPAGGEAAEAIARQSVGTGPAGDVGLALSTVITADGTAGVQRWATVIGEARQL